MVSMPATGPKGRGFQPGRGDGFLRATKIRRVINYKRQNHCCMFHSGLTIITMQTTMLSSMNHCKKPVVIAVANMRPFQTRPYVRAQEYLGRKFND
jgi:hypothetical protein